MFGPRKYPAPRLGQWKGRRHSSRVELPLLQRLGHRSVLCRLAIVWLTTVAVTLLAYWGGPPLPYRAGETRPFDIKARVDFQVVNYVEWARQQQAATEGPFSLGATTEDAWQLGLASGRSLTEKYAQGILLVPAGQPIHERQLELLAHEHQAYLNDLGPMDHCQRGIGLFIVFSLLAVLIVLYVSRFQIGLAQSLPTIIGICLLVLATLTLGLLLSQPPWHAVFIPLTMTAMVLTLAYNPQFALLMAVSLSVAMNVVLGANVWHLLQQLAGLAAVVLLLRNVRSRTQLVQVAGSAGLAYLLMTVATGLLSGQTAQFILTDALRFFLWGSLAGFLLTGLLPLVERAFNIVTDISLLELADGSHPLLQELVRRAPGTYTHSITVATLAEAAAEAINANPLLTRVGSYFHDVGKMLKPNYFIENQNGANLHDALEPALSTLVIIGHIKDGLALAKQYGVPRPIADFIAQHHGTTLVEYFYREAMRLQQNNGGASVDLEASFRYPGPKPQTRESGILMLADAVESTSRSLKTPTPASLRKLVHDLLMKRLLDGQFEESGLTLTELHLVEESLSKSLVALFHVRIQYPEESPRQKAS